MYVFVHADCIYFVCISVAYNFIYKFRVQLNQTLHICHIYVYNKINIYLFWLNFLDSVR